MEFNFKNNAIGAWFKLTDKAGNSKIKLFQSVWDSTELSVRYKANGHPFELGWQKLNQDDWQESLRHGYVDSISRGLYERTKLDHSAPTFAILWIHDNEDPIAIVQEIQNKLNVSGESVRIFVNLLDHLDHHPDDPDDVLRWKTRKIDDLWINPVLVANSIKILDELEDAIDL